VKRAPRPDIKGSPKTALGYALLEAGLIPQLPRPRRAAEDEESGRGLLLVRTLADSWGVRPTDEGKTTWFTLRL
ncbi:ATP-binding protein, partial [Streptomyces sp. NPDC005921]